MPSKTHQLIPHSSRFLCGWLLTITVILVVRPIETSDLWWSLARGREVFREATLAPSSQLLELDEAREADWLGGLPFYTLWSLGGVHALASIPLIAGLALAWSVWKQHSSDRPHLFLFLIFPLAVIVMRDGLQPSPVLYDLIGLLILGRWLVSSDSHPPSPFKIFLLFLLWSNLGPEPLWGVLLLVAVAPASVLSPKLLLAAILGGICNPRGIFVWWDSAILTAPLAFLDPANFHEIHWKGLFLAPRWDSASVAFLTLWGAWVVHRVREKSGWEHLPRWSIPLLGAILSRANLPLCGMWILLDLLIAPGARSQPESKPKWLVPAYIGMFCLVLVDAAGLGMRPSARLSWGISSANDIRLIDLDPLRDRPQPYVGWAADSRSAGMIAWLEGNVRLLDHPQRALLGGRWSEHSELMDDLITSHRARFRRDDGSWGGWVSQVAEWNVEVLMVPAENRELHRALVATPWQPIDLDAPSVPYVSADDLSFASVVLASIGQQHFVETGAWQPTVDVYASHGWRFDPIEAVGLGPDPGAAIRQSRFFRALNIPMASLRALFPMRQLSTDRALKEEFWACQSELAYQEWVTFGQSSRFRTFLLEFHPNRSVRSNESHPWETLDRPLTPEESESWNRCAELYLSADLSAAAEALPRDRSDERYARAMIRLEAGETDRAIAELKPILTEGDDEGTTIAARYWLEQISSPPSP